MSRNISSGKLSYLRSIVAGPAAEARGDRRAREAAKVEEQAAARIKAEFNRQHAPDQLQLALEDAKRAEQEATEERNRRRGRDVVSDIYLTSSQIAGRKAPVRTRE